MEEDLTDPNEEIALVTTRAGLRRLVEAAWHDSCASTGERAVDAAVRRADGVLSYAGPGPFHVGTWIHGFVEDGVELERSCRVVVDPLGRIVAMTVQRDQKQRDASREEIRDVEESLEDNDVARDFHQHDLVEAPLPGWACDQIAERIVETR